MVGRGGRRTQCVPGASRAEPSRADKKEGTRRSVEQRPLHASPRLEAHWPTAAGWWAAWWVYRVPGRGWEGAPGVA